MVSREARRCALLWRCYLAAELHYGRPQAARRVFLRAIHECPGSQVRSRALQLEPKERESCLLADHDTFEFSRE